MLDKFISDPAVANNLLNCDDSSFNMKNTIRYKSHYFDALINTATKLGTCLEHFLVRSFLESTDFITENIAINFCDHLVFLSVKNKSVNVQDIPSQLRSDRNLTRFGSLITKFDIGKVYERSDDNQHMAY